MLPRRCGTHPPQTLTYSFPRPVSARDAKQPQWSRRWLRLDGLAHLQCRSLLMPCLRPKIWSPRRILGRGEVERDLRGNRGLDLGADGDEVAGRHLCVLAGEGGIEGSG